MARSTYYGIQVRHTGPEGGWYWRVLSPNGQIILTSETYSKRGNALRAARKFWLAVPPGWLWLEDEVNE